MLNKEAINQYLKPEHKRIILLILVIVLAMYYPSLLVILVLLYSMRQLQSNKYIKFERKRVATFVLLMFLLRYYAILPGVLVAALFFGVGPDVNPELPSWYQNIISFSIITINLIAEYAVICIIFYLAENLLERIKSRKF